MRKENENMRLCGRPVYDTWIWVRDHTPFGHDYKIYSFTDESGDLTYPYAE
jgi:hypothetical protein